LYYNRNGIYLLFLSFLSIAATNGFCSAAAYAQVDISISDKDNGIYTAIMSGSIIYFFKGNLLNLTAPLEHSVEIDADQIFPNETLKHEMISKPGSYEFTMPTLNYDLLGFNISASDIKLNGCETGN
jgi:hypothetical protein